MIKNLLSSIWRAFPPGVRRWTMLLMNSRFTVTAGAIVFNEDGDVLLLKHRFRPGSGWGFPGGFLEAGEQPLDGLRRELREEIGLEVDRVEIFDVRSFRKPRQVEILFRAFSVDQPKPQSVEIEKAGWFAPDSLPPELPEDQQRIIKQVVSNGANR